MEMNYLKKIAAEKAVEIIKDDMVIGLGSGSTVYWFLKSLGEAVEKGLRITGIPSSRRTEAWAKEFGIPLTTFSEVRQLDIAVDGADEVDSKLNLIKGGGGSLLREKIVDAASKELIIIVDHTKIVTELGRFPLPVEVVQFGWEVTAQKIAKLGCTPELRIRNGEVFVSDNGNYILDCQFESIPTPREVHQQLKQIIGVVETGLFIEMTDKVIVSGENNEVTLLEI